MTTEFCISGRCRCGDVSFSCSAQPLFAGYCHCNACRQRTSSPCTSFLMLDQQHFSLTGNTHSYREAGGSGAPIEHHRCANCGMNIYSKLFALRDVLAVPSELLNDATLFQPTEHVWVSAKVDWLEISDDLKQQPGPPGMTPELISRLALSAKA